MNVIKTIQIVALFTCQNIVLALRTSSDERITLLTFDGASDTTYKFHQDNDPIMGGISKGTWSVSSEGQYGILNGTVEDVPSLKAPGFLSAYAYGHYFYKNVSQFLDGDLILGVRSSTSSYGGFRISFTAGALISQYSCAGGGGLPFSGGCYKAHFNVPEGDDFSEVRIPFKIFSDHWNPATGKPTKTCMEDESVCPTYHDLAHIRRIDLWAEGVKGPIHLEIKSISAGIKKKQLNTVPSDQNQCQGQIKQDQLLFGYQGRTSNDFIPGETLAEAVCCDKRMIALAEPRYTFEAPDIRLFSRLNPNQTTTFYDPVCGLPLFRAPVNRSFEDFKADSEEHGWPSFRNGEVFEKNVVTYPAVGGLVTSTCGTHLGTYLPDEKGERWCIDLACIAGPPPPSGV